MWRSLGSGLVATLLLSSPAPAQTKSSRSAVLPPAPSSRVTVPTKAPAKSTADLSVYGTCAFPDGLQVTDVQSMPSDVHDRPVQVHGATKQVPLIAGRRVTFAYPGAQPFASAKVEELPAENFAANRKLLFDDFDDIVASDKTVTRNSTKGPSISSFSIAGLDRNLIAGNTLGIYMLVDDRTHVATTVYLLNPAQSNFKTIADYTRSRDTFLYNYTRCIRNNQNGLLFGAPK